MAIDVIAYIYGLYIFDDVLTLCFHKFFVSSSSDDGESSPKHAREITSKDNLQYIFINYVCISLV